MSVQVDDHLVIFDAGTGLRNLGQYLEDKDCSQWKGSILLSHYHWDHIQGLPFFEPAYRRQNRFRIYGKPKHGIRIEDILAEQMESPFFPVDMDSLEGLVTFEPVQERMSFTITPKVTIRTIGLNHLNGAIGYRLEHPDGSICYISDHEHPVEGLDRAVVDFVHDATILIHDAQYMVFIW